MRIGLIARADKTGLGVQTWSFWRNMDIHKMLIVDLSEHSRQQPITDQYDGATFNIWSRTGYPSTVSSKSSVVEEFLKDLDVVFTCETPYNYWLFERAKELGVKTVLQFNYEFLDYMNNTGLPEPDLFLAPSKWHLDDVKRRLPNRNIEFLPVPVDRTLLPFKKRHRLKSIFHSVGTSAMLDRNGTDIVLDALQYLKSPIQVRITSQVNRNWDDPRVSIINRKFDNFWELYGNEDLFVMPRKFGGLCLPMNEAISVGMPIVSSACSPQTDWIPSDLLIPAFAVDNVMTRAPIDVYECSPVDLAAKLDELYENPDMVSEYSEWADWYAESISWTSLKPQYVSILNNI
jgi:glycosyltransferase involved in cell wall biosynthesis